VQNGTFSFPGYPGEDLTHVNVQVQKSVILAQGSTSYGGSFSVKGNFHSKNQFDLIADLHKIPTIAFDQLLSDDYDANDSGVRPVDVSVFNNYIEEGDRNPHKSYGYLRSPGVAQVIDEFLSPQTLGLSV